MSIFSEAEIEDLKGMIGQTKPDEDELEIRFGQFLQNRKFKPGMTKSNYPGSEGAGAFISKINKDAFERVKETSVLFKPSPILYERSVVWATTSLLDTTTKIRTIYTLDDKNKPIKSVVEKKSRKGLKNFPGLSLRVTLSREEAIDKNPEASRFSFVRYRDRMTRFSKDGFWRYDFTISRESSFGGAKDAGKTLKEILDFGEEKNKYELEIEYIGGKIKVVEAVLESMISQIMEVNKVLDPKFALGVGKGEVYSEIYNLFPADHFDLKERKKDSLDFRRDLISDVVSLQMNDIGILETQEYSVTDKADGIRHLLFVRENKSVVLINSSNEVKKINMKVKEDVINSLVDGELINGKLFAVFDILVYAGKNLTMNGLKDRLEYLKKFVGKIEKGSDINIALKKFEFKKSADSDIYKLNESVLHIKREYHVDGLIFTPVHSPYKVKPSKTFKWKPPEETTIDFLIRRYQIFEEYIEFHLYVGITRREFQILRLKDSPGFGALFPQIDRNTNYFPTLFRPEDKNDAYIVKFSQDLVDKEDIQDNTIIELVWKPDSKKGGKWKFVKNRQDRTREYRNGQNVFGNSWRSAMSNWRLLMNPITKNMILGKEKIPFFADVRTRHSNIQSMKRFHSFIKFQMYNKYAKGSDYVLEAAIGRYGDIFKWTDAGIKNVVGIDVDKNAIQEGEAFVANLVAEGSLKKAPTVYSIVGSFADSTDLLISGINEKHDLGIEEGVFDVVSCQFALHFFTSDSNTFDKFAENVRRFLKKGGIFMATTIDGKKLDKLLRVNKIEDGESFDLKMKDKKADNKMSTVFSIRRLYDDTRKEKMLETGQQISVFVESIGSTNREYLVNFEYIEKVFKKKGIELVKKLSFEDLYKTWKQKGESDMSNVEKIFSFLNSVLVFRKK